MNFKRFILDPLEKGKLDKFHGIPTPLPRLSKKIGYLEQGNIIAISGRANSGKVSFMDFFYFFSILEWWSSFPVDRRPPVKIFYIGTKTTLKLKMQKWLCTYLSIKHGELLDIMTLIGGVGKRRDVDDRLTHLIESAEMYFEDMEQIVQFISHAVTPADIFNIVTSYFENIGDVDKNKVFQLNKEYSDHQSFIFIDNVKRLMPESDDFNNILTEKNLQKRLKNYLITLKGVYNTTSIICVPTENSNLRSPKDSEPNYKDLGVFSEDIDLGLVLYNPWTEKNLHYQAYDIANFVFNGKDRFRSVSVVKSTLTASNLTLPLIFLGECGKFSECPLSIDGSAIDEKLSALRNLEN